MKTHQQIVERTEAVIKNKSSMLNFDIEIYASYLSFEQAECIRNESVTKDEWGKVLPLTEESVTADMKDYMDFAWGKAEHHRGLSSMRSIEKMKAWLWLLEDYEMVLFAEEDHNYAMYGAPIVKAISEKYGFEIPESATLEKMVQGEVCDEDCCECSG